MTADDITLNESFITADISAMTYDDSLSSLRLIAESHSGFCRIYSAVKDGKRVIIKSLKPEYASSTAHRQLLAKEYDIASGMHHPGIVETFSFETLPALGPSIVMEYVNGLDLATFTRYRGSISQADVRHIFNLICSAVAYIHSRGIIHRDLKPQNILVSPDGQTVKIIDFGLAHGANYLTFDFPGGTRGFCAPEQTTQNQPADPRSDIYSLGAVMQLLAPFSSRSWKSLAERCMSDKINARPASVTELLSLASQSRRRSRRNITIAAASILAIGGIGIAALNLHSTNDRHETDPGYQQPVRDISHANQLIKLVKEGKVKDADYADVEEGFPHYAAIWNADVYTKTGQWLSVGFKGNSVYFYLVSNNKFTSTTRDSMAAVAGFHNSQYYPDQGYWWYLPIDMDLFAMDFANQPDYTAILNRANLLISRINAVTPPTSTE